MRKTSQPCGCGAFLLKKELREAYAGADVLNLELDNELNNVMDSAVNAGMVTSQAENLRMLVASRKCSLRKKRTTKWNRAVGLYLPMEESTSNSFNDIVAQHNSKYKTEEDLRKLCLEYPGYYQNRVEVTKGSLSPQDDGNYIVSLFNNNDARNVIHEMGYCFVDTIVNRVLILRTSLLVV